MQKPDRKDERDYWAVLVNAKIQTPKQACKRMNLKYDKEFWEDAKN